MTAPRNSIVIDLSSKPKTAAYDILSSDEESKRRRPQPRQGRHLKCSWLPCCMSEEDAESFGHHVSIFMVALVAFATFFCVTLILILVFLLG
ncbi:unnamed protein product [Caenorhabditis auriculariae]|uniref:Uncharacterized protein n=1 Tax=Caenorhabditis auriculariae TaxID=2777116 RepID=A0A8S1HQS0_9PELO|nr:unnamed protein product [Caenorhabditis auriculariae]